LGQLENSPAAEPKQKDECAHCRHNFVTEVADSENHGEDCDPTTFGGREKDGDGFYDLTAFNRDGRYLYRGTDCNDNEARVNPAGSKFATAS
jgi:hypothetical protein